LAKVVIVLDCDEAVFFLEVFILGENGRIRNYPMGKSLSVLLKKRYPSRIPFFATCPLWKRTREYAGLLFVYCRYTVIILKTDKCPHMKRYIFMGRYLSVLFKKTESVDGYRFLRLVRHRKRTPSLSRISFRLLPLNCHDT